MQTQVMTIDTPPRSALYMPACRPRLLEKGATLGCDAVIADLEDSVVPDAKSAARRDAVAAFATIDYGERIRVLRINGADTPWHAADIAAVADATPDAVLLPKCDDAQAVSRLCDALDAAGVAAGVRVWAMLETPAAVLSVAGYGQHGGGASRLTTFCVGNNDLAKAAGLAVPTARTVLQPWLMAFVACAKANALHILDGVWNDFRDADGLAGDCDESVACGFDGRTLIHPAQIETANRAYSPGEDALVEARRVVAAFADPANAARGAISIDGRMVERLHLEMAERTLARAQRRVHLAATQSHP